MLRGVLVALPPESQLTQNTCYSPEINPQGGRYAYVEGSSFAAPEVAGIAALIWAARPGLSNYHVADIIKESAQPEPPFGWEPGLVWNPTDPWAPTWGYTSLPGGAQPEPPRWTPTLGCGLLDAGAALELATSRPASAWSSSTTRSTACAAEGDEPPTWPTELEQTVTFEPLPTRRLGTPEFRRPCDRVVWPSNRVLHRDRQLRNQQRRRRPPPARRRMHNHRVPAGQRHVQPSADRPAELLNRATATRPSSSHSRRAQLRVSDARLA